MDRGTVIDIFRANEVALRGLGVTHAALFGSIARGEGHSGSDLDVVIAIDEETVRDVFDYVGVTHFIGDPFPMAVDGANRKMLKARVKRDPERDAVHAF